MYLEQITIKNFRLFEDFHLQLNSGLNLLVGENNSGKTAIIDAIRLTLGTNSNERMYLQESDFHDKELEFSIQLKFVDIKEHAHRFVEHLTYVEDSQNSEKSDVALYVYYTARNTGTEKRGYPYIYSEIKSGKGGNGLSLDREIREFLAATYLKPLRDAEGELSSGRGSRLSQILNSSKDILAAENFILTVISDANTQLMHEESAIQKVAKKIEEDYLHNLIFEKDKKILKAIINIAGIQNTDGLSDKEKRKYLRKILEDLSLISNENLHKNGLGYNNLLFIAAELLLLEQESKDEFSILLIEEPEAHLHPQLQMKLLQFIVEKTQANNKNMQCILTTHSPNLSSKANLESVILLSEEKAFSLRSNETLLKKEDYQFLEKFLDVTKANLFFSRGIILVEGYAEQILIPVIAKLLGTPFEDHGISVINCQGTTWKRFTKLFIRKNHINDQKSWYPIKISVLRDLDLWPPEAETIEGNKFGFKIRKEKNEHYWLKGDEKEDEIKIAEKTKSFKHDGDDNLEQQNVKIFISDGWTLEYCLSFHGLFEECCLALSIEKNTKDKANTDSNIDKSVLIQKEIGKEKTKFVEKLILILEKKYKDNPEKLKKTLPPYIVNAIQHVIDKPSNVVINQSQDSEEPPF